MFFSIIHVPLFVPPWTVTYQTPLSSTISWNLLKFMSIESVMLSNHRILCHPILFLPPFSLSQHQSLFQWVVSSHQVANILVLQSQHWPFQWMRVLGLVAHSCLTLCDPLDCDPPCSSVHGDSPGKNTGMSCHGLLQGIFPTQGPSPGLPHRRRILHHLSHQGSPSTTAASSKLVCVTWLVLSNSLRPRGLQLIRLLCPWNSPRKNTGVGCHFFLQGICPTQGSNLALLHCRQILYHLSYHKTIPLQTLWAFCQSIH